MNASVAPHALRFGRDLPGGGRELRWSGPALMGVVNVTPDSFSDGGDTPDTSSAVAHALALAEEGALVVDVGGESTRPGAAPVDEGEELRRVVPVVERLADAGLVVSIDSRRPAVAAAALRAGAMIVNDIGGARDPAMRAVAAEWGAPIVAMHMQGKPETMQDDPRYGDVVAEVLQFLLEAAAAARSDGVPDVLVDPGIGFGKTVTDNLALVNGLAAFSDREQVLLGASRKSVIGAVSGEAGPKNRLPGTLVLHLAAAAAGAAMLRVHDVAAHAQALALWRALEGAHDDER